MEARAIARFLRVPPRKVRRVAAIIRGKRVDQALTLLRFTTLTAAKPLSKLVRSAAANAENNHAMKTEDLFIVKADVNAGPMHKRVEARARGQAALKRKRTSHVTVVVSDGESA